MTVTINGTTGIAGTNGSAGTPAVQGEDTNTGIFFPAADTVGVATAGTERARITSDGDLLVGKTTADGTTSNGVQLMSYGELVVTATDPTAVAFFTRKTTEGDIIRLRRDSTVVGNIGTYSDSNLYIDGGLNDAGIYFGSATWLPRDAGALIDGVIDLGSATYRMDDLYAATGTIQTSDRNEKQQIAALTSAEMQAAKAISGLFKTFKWNDSVAKKGDAARIHSGVIAQEIEAAMADAGLDAGRYAFFISSTWWEAEGQAYETAEEAPEGAVERTRKGIRYSELLAFVGAATEQRLASIEARLTALEAN